MPDTPAPPAQSTQSALSAVLFGSISTVADTSELQRAAFNDAFAEHGLGWNWDRDEYLGLLEKSGGAARIAEYAHGRAQEVDADAVHATKSRLFQRKLAESGIGARPGVLDTIKAAKGDGLKLGLVTTTSRENIDALLEALAPDPTREDFDVIVDVASVSDPKPGPAAYQLAVQSLGVDPSACVAIEDNVDGVASAVAAGIACAAFPNENTAGHEFPDAAAQVDHVDLAALRGLTRS